MQPTVHTADITLQHDPAHGTIEVGTKVVVRTHIVAAPTCEAGTSSSLALPWLLTAASFIYGDLMTSEGDEE